MFDYIDVDWIDDYDIRKFISKYVFNLKNDAINWFFKRQSIVTLSTCKIEYINQTQTIQKVIWLSQLLKKLKKLKKFCTSK